MSVEIEKAAERVADDIRRHHLMSSTVPRGDSIEFLENIQTLVEMELDGLREDQRREDGE